ncbi:MAG: UDP-N-acetylglucosamine--N-acetylmuramyl-(pentapeptide) pyrophosphoryl-undecaprenol N-acetylglucosamine transferase [Sphaerochaetaceae bacterium]
MKVCFTGGGTGGHIFPAFAVDSYLQDTVPQYHRFWLGSTKAIEREWITEAGIPMYPIYSGKLRRYFSWRLFGDVVGIIIGFFQSLTILYKEKPQVLFSKGGYVSVPPVWAAALLGIPVLTHESDASAGLATRLNALVAAIVCIPFAEAQKGYPKRLWPKVRVTGVPTRLRKSASHSVKKSDKPLIVVLGGSQGAKQINELVWNHLDQLVGLATVVHQTGSSHSCDLNKEGYEWHPFIGKELEQLLGKATLVISRAGATALADYMEMEVPMLLIPLGKGASRGDQIENAKRLEHHGAAKVLDDESRFFETVKELLDCDIVRQQLVQQANALYLKEADKIIGQLLIDLSKRRKGRWLNGC